MDKELFDDAIGEVPPPTVDVEAVINHGRRADRLRRATPMAAAGVAVLLVGAVAYTMTSGDGTGGTTVGTAPATTAPSTPGPPPTSGTTTERGVSQEEAAPNGKVPQTPVAPQACSRTGMESAAQVNSRLTDLARQVVQEQRPEVHIVPKPGQGKPALEFFQVNSTPGREQPVCGDAYSMATASLEAPEGVGNITIVVQPAFYAAYGLGCEEEVTADQVYCDAETTREGDRVVRSAEENPAGAVTRRVEILRVDGTSVTVVVENVPRSSRLGGPPSAQEPTFDHEQLVAIGTHPGMTLFP